MLQLELTLCFGALLCASLTLLFAHLYGETNLVSSNLSGDAKNEDKSTAASNPLFYVYASYAWLALACASAIYFEYITWYAPLYFFTLTLLSYFYLNEEMPNYLNGLAFILLIPLSLALASHLLPGFSNYLLIPFTHISANAYSFQQYINFDKAFAAIALASVFYLLNSYRSQRQDISFGNFYIPLSLHLFVVLGLAFILGAINFDFKYSLKTAQFLTVNLLITCMAEEFFFRGIIQRGIENIFPSYRYIGWLALLASTVLFGLAHQTGGIQYSLLAAISGLFNAYIYMKSRRIELAVLSHFALNAVHFCFFTYPAFAR